MGPASPRAWRLIGDASRLAFADRGRYMADSDYVPMPTAGLTDPGYLRSRADLLGIDPEFTEKHDLHIHVPEGAIPKDGPSAGITMATALVSAVTRRPVRRDLAMTGEITLRGKVLPVGGIKDKALAAFRAGIHQVILPRENEKDLEDIPAEVREILTVHFVESMDEVLHLALEGELASPPPGGGELQSASSEPPMGSGSLAH